MQPSTARGLRRVLSIVNCTVIGKAHTKRLDLASNTIFAAALARRQLESSRLVRAKPARLLPVFFRAAQFGCPRRYRCQPDLAVEAALLEADQPKGSLTGPQTEAITLATQARVQPAFTVAAMGRPPMGNWRDIVRRKSAWGGR